MPRRYVVRRAHRSYGAPFNFGHLRHAVPLLEPHEWGNVAQALCGLVPRKGWDTRPCPDMATAETVTCPRCRRWLIELKGEV
jgi:hypothetical protein